MTAPRMTNALRMRTMSGLGFQLPASGGMLVDELAHRVQDFGPAAVVEADVEHAVRVVRGPGHGLIDALSHPRGQLVAPATDHNSHPTLVHLVDLALHGLVEETHERPDLGSRARPVLGREGVDGQGVHTQAFASLEHALVGAATLPGAEA